MATLHTYIPRCPADLEHVLPDRQTRRHFPTLPGGVPRKKLSGVAARSGGGNVLTPRLPRTTAFWAALTGEGQA
jgi:hypothetical protein